MSRIVRVTHTVDELQRDLTKLPNRAAKRMATLVKRNAEMGNRRAVKFATESSGRHGKHYPDSFSAEAVGPFSWEYGPNAFDLQGGMSFEFGSRNQPPHLDLNQSADIIGPKLEVDVRKMFDRLFW